MRHLKHTPGKAGTMEEDLDRAFVHLKCNVCHIGDFKFSTSYIKKKRKKKQVKLILIFIWLNISKICLSQWFSAKEPTCQCRWYKRLRFKLWVGNIPWRRMTTNILAWKNPWTEEPGGCSPWGCKDLDMTEHTSTWYTKYYHFNKQQ